jgi:hypothetical protein
MESRNPQSASINKQPISREGNKALEVERPLFDKGQKWEFQTLKSHYLTKYSDE